MAPPAQWIRRFVTDDKIYCLYLADNAEPSASTPAAADFPQTTSRSSGR